MVKKLNCWKSRERGKELKIPYYASAAAARDGNLPQLALNNGHLPLFPTVMKLLGFIKIKKKLINYYIKTY